MKLILRLAKGDPARFLSHLELYRCLERAARRAGLPLAYSQGFNPRPRLAFCSALAVGATSEGELVELELREPVPAAEAVARLNAQLPAGLAVLGAREAPPGSRPLAGSLRWAAYRLGVEGGRAAGDWAAAALRFLDAASCPLDRDGRVIDARRLVAQVEVRAEAPGRAELLAVLRCSQEEALRPEELVRALERFLPEGGAGRLVSVHRLALLGERPAGPFPLWETGPFAGAAGRGDGDGGAGDPDQR